MVFLLHFSIHLWIHMIQYDLVGGIPTPLKNMRASWDDYSQYGKLKNVPNHQPEYDMCSTFFIKPPETTLQIGYGTGLLGQMGSASQSALSPSNSKGRSKGTVKILMTGGGTASVGMPWSLAKLSHLNALWKEYHKTITSKIVQIHPKKQASACTSSHLCPQKKVTKFGFPDGVLLMVLSTFSEGALGAAGAGFAAGARGGGAPVLGTCDGQSKEFMGNCFTTYYNISLTWNLKCWAMNGDDFPKINQI